MEYYSSLPKRQRRRERDTTAATNEVVSSLAVPATTATKDDPTSSDDEDEMLGQLIYNSSRTAQLRREQQRGKSEGGEELAPQQHTATITIAKPPNDPRVHNMKSLSGISISNKATESAPKKKKKKKHVHKSFEQRIEDLRAYKEKHGHICVKQSDDKSLYKFCQYMRHARNNPEKSRAALTENRIASLDALGFEWSPKPNIKSFEQRMEDLHNYKEKHGHVNVKEREDKSLNQFCYNMRHARNHPEKSSHLVNDDRISSLDALGFEWTVKDRPYPNDPRVRKSKCPSHRTNNEIESAPKTKKKKKKRVQCVRKSFEQRIEGLRAYKEKYGHIHVKWSDDKSLYKFCHNIRNARDNPEKSNMPMNEERIASLDALGFDWTASEYAAKKSFEQRISDLRAYKEKHGHLSVNEKEDKSLYYFCCNIRQARKHPGKSKMTVDDDRIASLDTLGFKWNLNSDTKSFGEHAAQLKGEQQRGKSEGEEEFAPEQHTATITLANPPNNDPRVRKSKCPSHRTNKEIESAPKKKKRVRIGTNEMESAPKKKRLIISFEQRIEDLRAYKEEHGHINVKQSEDKSLYQFCIHMRRAHDNPEKSDRALTDDRVASLDDLGFQWSNSGTKSFEQRIEGLRAYKEKHGHVNVKKKEDKSL